MKDEILRKCFEVHTMWSVDAEAAVNARAGCDWNKCSQSFTLNLCHSADRVRYFRHIMNPTQSGLWLLMLESMPGMAVTGIRAQRHDDIIKWKHFPRYWPFVRGIHRSLVNYPHKGQWRRTSILSLFCDWTKIEQTIETPVISDAIALIMTSL